ncbi:MAG: hypothetical protein RBS23_10990 [Mariniphaga sp.]|nr:hypothetical protein [Mariniphaga sp.]
MGTRGSGDKGKSHVDPDSDRDEFRWLSVAETIRFEGRGTAALIKLSLHIHPLLPVIGNS